MRASDIAMMMQILEHSRPSHGHHRLPIPNQPCLLCTDPASSLRAQMRHLCPLAIQQLVAGAAIDSNNQRSQVIEIEKEGSFFFLLEACLGNHTCWSLLYARQMGIPLAICLASNTCRDASSSMCLAELRLELAIC